MGNPVVHFEIGVNDSDAANKFYADLFGWKIDSSNPMNYGIVDTDSAGEDGDFLASRRRSGASTRRCPGCSTSSRTCSS